MYKLLRSDAIRVSKELWGHNAVVANLFLWEGVVLGPAMYIGPYFLCKWQHSSIERSGSLALSRQNQRSKPTPYCNRRKGRFSWSSPANWSFFRIVDTIAAGRQVNYRETKLGHKLPLAIYVCHAAH